MSNNQGLVVRKNLFKVKKVAIETEKSTIFNSNKRDAIDDIGIAIVVPAFNSYRLEFEEDLVEVLAIDGRIIRADEDSIILSNTRIMDAKIKEKLNDVIPEAKKNYEHQKKLAKHQEEYKKIKESLEGKLSKGQERLNKSFANLKKVRGFLTNEDVIKHLNKKLDLSKKFRRYSKDDFRITLLAGTGYGGAEIEKVLCLSFSKDSISSIRVFKEVDFGKWCAEHYDFVFKEYDRTLHIRNLENSSDFKKIKSQYFKSNSKSITLKKPKIEEYFDVAIGDKDSLYAYHSVYSEVNIECSKKNLKKIEEIIKKMLVLV